MADKRKRKRIDFWLDSNNDDDYELIGEMKKIKKARNFTDLIRLAVQLLTPLFPSKKTDSPNYDEFINRLFTMFPEIKNLLHARMEADVLENLNLSKSDEMIHHMIELKGIVSQFKNQPMLASQVNGQLTMRRVTVEEELNLEVTAHKGDGNATQNFLRSMQALQPVADKPSGIKALSSATFDAPVYEDDDDLF